MFNKMLIGIIFLIIENYVFAVQPSLATMWHRNAVVGHELNFTVYASDASLHALTYSVDTLPQGAIFNTNTQAFSWTPETGQAGDYTIMFHVTDGVDTDSEDIVIQVAAEEILEYHPVLMFTDLTSAPDQGWSPYNPDRGAAVSVWGNNFGLSRGDSYVTVNGVDLTSDLDYAEWGIYKPTPYHQRITFWLKESCIDGEGTISVTVNGQTSNTLPFTIRNGNIYFVDNGNPETGEGTHENPWRSLSHFAASMQAGDIVYIREGTGFYGGIYSGGQSNIWVRSTGVSGTEAMPIAFVGYPNEEPYFDASDTGAGRWNFEFDQAWYTVAKLKMYGTVLCVSAWHGTRVVGNDCRGLTQHMNGIGTIQISGSWAKILGNSIHGSTTDNRMDHAIYFGLAGHLGPNEAGWNYIFNNSYDIGPIIALNYQEDRCPSGTMADDHFIHDNIIDSTNYPCRAVTAIVMSYDPAEIDTAPATIYDPTRGEDVPYVYDTSRAVYIYNNLMIGCGITAEDSNDGVNITAIDHWNGSAYIYNNTFYNTNVDAIRIASAGNISGADGHNRIITVVRNNIIHMNSLTGTGYFSRRNGEDWNTLIIENNLYSGIGDYLNRGPAYNEPIDTHSVNASDPLWMNDSIGDFRLQESSLAVNAGNSSVSPIVLRDLLGLSRPQENAFDLGAYEFLSSSQENSPSQIQILSDVSLFEGEICQFTVTVNDSDISDILTLQVSGNPGGTLEMTENRTWQFSWQTDFSSSDNSPYFLTFIANDSMENSTPANVQVVVNNVNNNLNPSNNPDWIKDN